MIPAYKQYLLTVAGLSPRSVASFSDASEKFLTTVAKPPGEITTADVLGYLGTLGDLAPATRSLYLFGIKSFFNYMIVAGLRPDNPAATIRAPKIPQSLPKALSREQIDKLLARPNSSEFRPLRNHAILQLLYSSGIRLSELTSLKVDDLDLAKSTFIVRGKGNKQRVCLLDDAARLSVASWLDVRPLGQPKSLALFISSTGKPLVNGSVQAIVGAAGEQAGLGHIHVHQLRHSIATRFYEATGDLLAVKVLLGHSRLETTERYARASMSHLEEVYKKVMARG